MICAEPRRKARLWLEDLFQNLRAINGGKSVCDFSEKQIKAEHKTAGDALDKIIDISTVEVMLTRHLFKLL